MDHDDDLIRELRLYSRTLEDLKLRIERIEKHLELEAAPADVRPVQNPENASIISRSSGLDNTESDLELRIGLYWFGRVGVVALVIGLVFLLLQPFSSQHPVLSSAGGFVIAGGVILLSRFLKHSFTLLSGYLLGGGLIILFVSTLHLHYFSAQPFLGGSFAETLLLLIVVGFSLIVSIRRKSSYLAAISLSMGFAVALMSGQLYLFFAVSLIMAALTSFIAAKYHWVGLLIYGMVVTYLAQLEWFFNNPAFGNTLELREIPYGAMFLLLLLTAIFSLSLLLRNKDGNEGVDVNLSAFLNLTFGYGLFIFLSLLKFQDHLLSLHLTASLVFLLLAIVFWLKQNSRFRTFVYAMTGYTALSVAIVAGTGTPTSFVLLCWQSLLVVSTAVLFRSKYIVIANFVIFTIVFIAYLALAGSINITSLSFGVVAILSARILNWQQSRLDLKTDMLRSAYLVAAFFIFPYALYHIVPGDYVGLSWLGVAIVYYIISVLLKNVKYRWMALLTFLMTAFYLIIIGTTRLGPTFRIISFLILGIALLVISFLYAKMRMKPGTKDTR